MVLQSDSEVIYKKDEVDSIITLVPGLNHVSPS